MDDLWPLAALRVRSGDLELRYMDDADVHALARLAAEGIHAPEAMPFTVPWTRGTPDRGGPQHPGLPVGCSARRSRPEKWNLELAVVRDGEVLGTQSLMAHDFPVTPDGGDRLVARAAAPGPGDRHQDAADGSWLGLRHHGQGVGTRMRLMILHLFFEGFDGLRATTSAFDDNGPSNGVTRRIGYAENGVEVLAREGKPAVSRRYVLDRAAWDARPAELRPEVSLVGVDGAREQLGRLPRSAGVPPVPRGTVTTRCSFGGRTLRRHLASRSVVL